MHVIRLVVDVIKALQLRLAATEIGHSVHIHAQGLYVHLRRFQISLRTYLRRARMQAVTGNQMAVQVNTGISVQRI